MSYLFGIKGLSVRSPAPVINTAVKSRKRTYSGSLKNTDTFSHFSSDSPSVNAAKAQRKSEYCAPQPIGFTLAKGAVKVDSEIISLKDYPKRKEEGIENLKEICNESNSVIAEKLEKNNVPKNIEFDFDYNITNNSVSLSNISDKSYADGVLSALNEVKGSYLLTHFANSSKILNGKMEDVYYSMVSNGLKDSFGQDISKLFLNEDGSVGGANAELSAALKRERSDPDFDARTAYHFVSKPLYSVIRRMTDVRSPFENISHMSFRNNKLSANDGDIYLGETDLAGLDDSYMLRTASAGHWFMIDIWAENEDMV